MTTVSSLITAGAKRLAEAGIVSARIDARILLAHALGVKTNELLGTGDIAKPDTYDELLDRRAAHEPVAYITGTREFWSLDFAVGHGVLIPRPETETLIEQAIVEFPDRLAPLSALDLGTGSGCIPIAFLSEYPNANGIAVDASPSALVWARQNIERHGLQMRCTLRINQWTDGLAETFDVIFSNPPYIEHDIIPTLDPDVAHFEPRSALDGGVDGYAAYRELAPRIALHLKQPGRAFVELGKGQDETVCAIFAAAGLETIRVAPDLSGVKRCLVARRSV